MQSSNTPMRIPADPLTLAVLADALTDYANKLNLEQGKHWQERQDAPMAPEYGMAIELLALVKMTELNNNQEPTNNGINDGFGEFAPNSCTYCHRQLDLATAFVAPDFSMYHSRDEADMHAVEEGK